MDNIPLKPGERLDDLLRGGLFIIQQKDAFRFGTDAVLLADFARARKNERACDLGSGSGVLPLLLSARAKGLIIDALEIQPELCDMARRSVALNGLNDSINIYCGDIRHLPPELRRSSYDLVVANPPYGKADSLPKEEGNPAVRIARHEVLCTLDDVIAAAAYLLTNGGRFCLVHQSARAAEAMACMTAHGIAPKVLRCVHHRADKEAKLILLEGRKQGGIGLTIQPPLLLRDQNGAESAEYRRIYGYMDDRKDE